MIALPAVGVISLFLARGLLKGRSWAWTTGIIIASLYVMLSVGLGWWFSGFHTDPPLPRPNVMDIIPAAGVVIPVIIILYLSRPHVKAFFGKGLARRRAPSMHS